VAANPVWGDAATIIDTACQRTRQLTCLRSITIGVAAVTLATTHCQLIEVADKASC
jgi:hypothetical protein